MQILKQSTAIDVLIGPFLDKTDAATAETGESPSVKLSKNGQALAAKNDATTPVSDADGYYNCELDATDTNTVGMLTLTVASSANALAVRHEYMVVEEAVFVAQFASSAPGYVVDQPVDAYKISGDATAADNLELMYDGTGYTDATAPASRSQVSSIGSSTGAGFNYGAAEDNTGGAIKSITFVGTQTSGTYTSTDADDGTYHNISHDTNTIDIVYGFDVGGARLGVEFTFKGYLTGANDTLAIQAYDFVGTTWDTRVNLDGQANTDNITILGALLSKHTGTGADLGKVYIRVVGTQTSPDLFIDELLVEAATSSLSIGYSGGAIWIDTAGSNTNTENYVDGTADNPVSTLAAATTLASQLNLRVFHLVPGSEVTLAQTYNSYEFAGAGFTVHLGGQDVGGSRFIGGAIDGIGTGSSRIVFRDCVIAATTTIDLSSFAMLGCRLANDITLNGAGTYILDQCFSGIAGTATPAIDFESRGTTLNINVNLRHYSGGIEVKNVGTGAGTPTDNISLEGHGQLVINANCTAGTAAIRGNFTVTDNASGALTLSDDARIDVAQINAEMVDVVFTDTDAEPGQGAPGATISIADKIGYLYKAWRNKSTQTATTYSLMNDDASTVDQKATVSDDTTTATKGEIATGP